MHDPQVALDLLDQSLRHRQDDGGGEAGRGEACNRGDVGALAAIAADGQRLQHPTQVVRDADAAVDERRRRIQPKERGRRPAIQPPRASRFGEGAGIRH